MWHDRKRVSLCLVYEEVCLWVYIMHHSFAAQLVSMQGIEKNCFLIRYRAEMFPAATIPLRHPHPKLVFEEYQLHTFQFEAYSLHKPIFSPLALVSLWDGSSVVCKSARDNCFIWSLLQNEKLIKYNLIIKTPITLNQGANSDGKMWCLPGSNTNFSSPPYPLEADCRKEQVPIDSHVKN